jgi:hypothetical protein
MTRKKSLSQTSLWIVFGAAVIALGHVSPAFARTAPAIKQPQCAQWSVLRCCQLLGVPVRMGRIMDLLEPVPEGNSMLDTAKALRKLGLQVSGRQEDYSSLLSKGFPVITHMQDHYVVVADATADWVVVYDMDGRRKLVPAGEFIGEWSGGLLRVTRRDLDVPLPESSIPHVGGTPRAVFDTLLMDRNIVPAAGELLEFVYSFRNAGDADLVVKDIKTSCNCLSVTKPEAAIKPGDANSITVRYRPPDRALGFLQEIHVFTNDPASPVITLVAAGNLTKTLYVSPQNLDFGEILPGTTVSRRLYVTYSGDIPLGSRATVTCDIEGMKTGISPVTQAAVRAERPGAKGRLRTPSDARMITVTYTAPQQPGRIAGRLSVNGPDADTPAVAVPVRMHVVSPVQVIPDCLVLPPTGSTETVTESVRLRSRDGRPFAIRSVHCPIATLDCEYADNDSTDACIVFRGSVKEAVAGQTVATVTVCLSGENEGIELALPIYALSPVEVSGPDS